MDEVLKQHGIPGEMKYLAVLNHTLIPSLFLMQGCGPLAILCLPLQEPADCRWVAAGMKELIISKAHMPQQECLQSCIQFNDWLLVVAAYNGGPGNVLKAIRKNWRKQGFLDTTIPAAESMNHVKEVYCHTHYIFEGEGGITTITKDETKDLLNNVVKLNEEEMTSRLFIIFRAASVLLSSWSMWIWRKKSLTATIPISIMILPWMANTISASQ